MEPDAPGIYVVRIDGAIEYIGEAGSLTRRLTEHRMSPWWRYISAVHHVEVSWALASESLQERRKEERRLIQEHSPRLNVLGKGKPSMLQRWLAAGLSLEEWMKSAKGSRHARLVRAERPV